MEEQPVEQPTNTASAPTPPSPNREDLKRVGLVCLGLALGFVPAALSGLIGCATGGSTGCLISVLGLVVAGPLLAAHSWRPLAAGLLLGFLVALFVSFGQYYQYQFHGCPR